MTLEIKFPRVLKPTSLEDLATVYYESMYEGKDESKKLIENLNKYCLDLNFNERAYMYTYIAKAQCVAKRMKKIKRRNFVRKEKAKFNKTISLEEATVNRNSYLKKIEEIKKTELERIEKKLENEIKGVETRRKIIRRGTILITPTTTGASLFISSNYVPLKIAELVASVVGFGTITAFYLLDKKETKKVEKITDEHYKKRKRIIQDFCEDQNGTENYYSERMRQIENEYSSDLLTTELDKESETEKHVSRSVSYLKKAWKTYGVDLEGSVNFDVMMKMLG